MTKKDFELTVNDRQSVALLAVCALLSAMSLVGWRYLSWGVSALPGASERPCVAYLAIGVAEDDVPATVCDIRRLP